MLIDMNYEEVKELKERNEISLKTFWYEGSDYRKLFEEEKDDMYISFNPDKKRHELYTKNI